MKLFEHLLAGVVLCGCAARPPVSSEATSERVREARSPPYDVAAVNPAAVESPTAAVSLAGGAGDLSAGSFAAPSDGDLLAQIHTALDLRRRKDADRFLDARDPGELLEHATISQAALDRGVFGLKDVFVIADDLFDYEFRPEQGLGNGLNPSGGALAGSHPAPNLRRVQQGEFGGPESHSCASCHSRGGTDAAGHRTQNAFFRGDGRRTSGSDERNPPHLLGLGPIAVLAREMTVELQNARSQAVEQARAQGADVKVSLETKGVAFGALVARADGSVDSSVVEGVDPDLVVKPFGWKGHSASLPEMVEESFRIHMGLLSARAQKAVRDGKAVAAEVGDGPWYDVDRDGVNSEIDSGMITSVAVYLAQLETPVIRPPRESDLLELFAKGQRLFETTGCAACHRPELILDDPVLEIRPLDPDLADRKPIRVDVAADGDLPKPAPLQLYGKRHGVRLFSDLRRHDLGPALATPMPQGSIPPTVFLTRPLWGLAFTSPYVHDGRAPTVPDAIELHGGEAAPARDRWRSLAREDRVAIVIFLLSLDRDPELLVP